MGASAPREERRACRRIAILIVGLLAIAQMTGAASSVGAAGPVTAQTAIARAERKLGPTAAQQRITIAVALAPLVNQQGMDAFLAELADPNSPAYHHYLTPQQFTAKFLDPAGRVAVADFLRSQGLTVNDTGVGSVINATGTVGQIEGAFNVTLNDYKDANGRTFYANDKTPALPAAVAPRIKAVLGLDNAPAWHSHVAKQTHPTPHAVTAKTATGCAGALGVLTTYGGYTPNQFATAFDFDTLYNAGFKGEGQTLALFELSDWSSSDSDTYKACFTSATPVNRINVDGGTTDTTGAEEVNLDIDVMLGMLPKMANLNVYVAPNSSLGVTDEYQRMATDNTASVISTSWGVCEQLAGPASPGSVVATENTIFFQMATQGQQIFAASGDDGSEDCYRATTPPTTILNTDDPASQPYMVAVGGTTVSINPTTNAYGSETVWNHNGNGGGGGLSQNWARPTWQSGPGVSNSFSNGNREVPDIAAPADPNTGYVVFTGGTWTVIGGTSGAAPFTASAFALTNQELMARVGHRLGFTSPNLYRILTNDPSALHDVTVGTNCAQGPDCGTALTGRYPATAGFDLATGVGTPKVGAITTYLTPPPPAPTPRPGPTSGSPAPNPLPPPRATGSGSTPGPTVPSPRSSGIVTGTPAPVPPVPR